jgi:hypothetical protein
MLEKLDVKLTQMPFRAGERIEVIEKDDQYGDGRWQVSPFSLMLNSCPCNNGRSIRL